LSHALLKLEQYRTTSSNLEKDIEVNTQHLNYQGLTLSMLNNELKKLYTDIQNKSRQIDLENKQLQTVKKKQEASKKFCNMLYVLQFNLILGWICNDHTNAN